MITSFINHELIRGGVSFFKVDFSRMSKLTSAARNGSRPYSNSAEQLFAIRPEKTVRIDMTVKRLACDPEFGAQLADLGAGLAHRGLGRPYLSCGHLKRAPAVAAVSPCRSQAGL